MKPNRRHFLAGSLSGFLGFAWQHRLYAMLANSSAKRCLVLWMNGGPSQFETFDPKPGSANGGQFGVIDTSAPGIRISENLPRIAGEMRELSVIRNLSSPEGEHVRGQYYLHTGFRFIPGFPRPAMGAVVSHESEPVDYPRYVVIGPRGFGPAYVGLDHAPFSIESAREAYELLRSIRQKRKRIRLLQSLSSEFERQHPDPSISRRASLVSKIDSLVSTRFVEALNLEEEPASGRERYGDSEFGKSCLLARRLLECGVNFVEVQHDGWDTHQNNFRRTQQLCSTIDRPWATLMQDLRSSGLLAETVVLWMGEFGRTPNINAQGGRDHFPRVTPAVIGGGGISGGQVVGETNRDGTQIVGDEVKVADLFATVFQSLGINLEQQFTTSFDSPTSVTDSGKPIEGLT